MNNRDDQIEREIVPRPVSSRVESELDFHVEMRTRELIARGVAPDEARARAVAAFGDFHRVTAELNRIGRATEGARRRSRFIGEALQDARFALRMIRRRRSAAVLTVGILSLGIGASTAIFSVADGVLLRPLPFYEPDRVAAVWIAQPALARDPVLGWMADATPMGNEEYQALRTHATSFDEIGLWSTATATLASDAGAEQVPIGVVTGSVFRTLRVSPAIGRTFVAGEDALGGPSVAILGWESWKVRFGGDSSIVGRSITIGGTAHTIVGIMRPGLRLDRTTEPPAFWVPALRDSSDMPERHNRSYRAIARLTRGATFEAASVQAGRILREVTGDTTLTARVEVWQRDQGRNATGQVMVLLIAVGLVLLIACVNAAMLQLGEVTARRQEMAARVSLGAGTGRLVRQLLGECVVLAFAASALGSALAWGMLRGLLAIAPERLPGMDTVHIDGRVLGFALVCATVTGVLFGIVPALVVGRAGTTSLLRTATGHAARGTALLQRGLIAAQVAMSMVLLVVGTLFARSLLNLTSVDPGFRADELVAVRVYIPYRYPADRVREIVAAFKARLESTAGVTAVTVNSSPPFAGRNSSSPIELDPAIARGRRPQHTMQFYVTPGYFETMGIRVVAGRPFRPDDGIGGEPVAIVNTAMVARDFGGNSPIGQRVRHQSIWRTVVGVAANVNSRALDISDGAGIYVPYDQHPNTGPTFLVRGVTGALTQPALRSGLRDVDARSVLQGMSSVDRDIERSYGPQRYRTILVSVFGAMAALLAAIGLHGVSSRAAARRLREIGIRMALGGTSRGVTGLLVADAMSGVGVGMILGVPAALLAGFAARQYLFGVSAADPVSIVLVALFLATATLFSSALPARRAARSNPAVVLRSD